MKKHRKISIVILALLVLGLIAAVMFAAGCGGDETTATEAPDATETQDSTASGENKILKIGHVGWFEFVIGLDMLNTAQVRVKMINDQGGIKIGDDTYDIELISYDHQNDQATAASATNRLIFEDEVKFIISDGVAWSPVIWPITEANNVIYCANAFERAFFSPDLKYCFQGGFVSNIFSTTKWIYDNYPIETAITGYPEFNLTEECRDTMGLVAESAGVDFEMLTYPPGSTDVSSIGTKVAEENPDAFWDQGYNLQTYKAAWNSGYRGMFFNSYPITTVEYLLTELTPEMIEGFVGPATAINFEPAKSQLAADFKEAWIEEYGEWTGAVDVAPVGNLDMLLAAMQAAGTVDDVDAIAAAISNGLEYESVAGPAKMVSRPDLGNDRTVDSVMASYMFEVVDGVSELIYTIDIDEMVELFYAGLGAASN